jgi:hypothetical protein
MDGALLMSNQDMTQFSFVQFIIDIDDGPAGIAKNGFNTLKL